MQLGCRKIADDDIVDGRSSKAHEDDCLGVRERVREVAGLEAWQPVDRVDDLDDVVVDSS